MDWEDIPGAKAYELKVNRVLPNQKLGKSVFFKVKKTKWKANVKPGKYQIRIRTYDDRDVPGEWSDSMDFEVLLPPVNVVTPVGQKIQADTTDNFEVNFKWETQDKVDEYVVVVEEESGKVVFEEESSRATLSKKLAVGQVYRWHVLSIDRDGKRGEAPLKKASFTLLGGELETPKLSIAKSIDTQKIVWSLVEGAEKYLYQLRRQKKKKWKSHSKGEVAATELNLPSTIPDGIYQLNVRAEKKLFSPSKMDNLYLLLTKGKVQSASRDLKGLHLPAFKKRGVFFEADYRVTNTNYRAYNAEIKGASDFDNTLTGTGLLGAGYQFYDSAWLLIGRLGMGGFFAQNPLGEGEEHATFMSAEGLAGWNSPVRFLGQTGHLLLTTGVYYKEAPEVVGDLSSNFFAIQYLQVVGIHLGGRYRQALSSSVGFEARFRYDSNLIGLGVPGGGDIEMTSNYSFGGSGYWSFSRKWVGFAGLDYWSEFYRYQSQTSSAQSSFIDMGGLFLNLRLEYDY